MGFAEGYFIETETGKEIEPISQPRLLVIAMRHAAHQGGIITSTGREQIAAASEQIWQYLSTRKQQPIHMQLGYSPTATTNGEMRAFNTGRYLQAQLEGQGVIFADCVKRHALRGLADTNFLDYLNQRVINYPEFGGDGINLWKTSMGVLNPDLVTPEWEKIRRISHAPSADKMAHGFDGLVTGLLSLESDNPSWMIPDGTYVFVLISHDDVLGPFLLGRGYDFGPADLVNNCEPIICALENGALHTTYQGETR